MLETIRRAEDYLEAWPHPTWRLSGLCAGAGIEAPVLRQACTELFGVRATRYLARFRLERLRRDLLASAEGAEDVAALARRWGLWHMPSLRLWYPLHFGETMESTRRRGLLAHGG